ncbi:MAG: hypothetical protein GTN99_04710, partial [Candidatus Dadabacteria bacterium]|nr:hypothetical protein [Candidatus Dadabacteria bacterium]
MVSVYKDAISNLSSSVQMLDEAITGPDGTALLKGLKDLDPELNTLHWRCSKENCTRQAKDGYCEQDDCKRLIIKVNGVGGMAIIPLINRFKVNTYRVSNYKVGSYTKKQYGHISTWGATAQGVYRLGDTIQYKIYVRNQDGRKFVPAPPGKYLLSIIDPKGKSVHKIEDITLSDFGGYSGEFTVPKNGAVGWY